jgi:hypothetical protein
MKGGCSKQAPESAGCPLPPTPGFALEETFKQHDDHPVDEGIWIQDFTNIVQQGGCKQVRVGLPGSLQLFKHFAGMGLLGGLHLAKNGDLGGGKIRQERIRLHPLSRTWQGIAKLAGTVSKAGKHQGGSPAVVCRQRGL